jgi:hypothetical protein
MMNIFDEKYWLETIARLVRRDYRPEEMDLDNNQNRILEAEGDLLPHFEYRRVDKITLEKGFTFSELLFKFIDDRQLNEVELYQHVGVSKSVFSKIRTDDDYQPDKDTVFKFAIGLQLNLEEGIEFLASAGFNFKVSSHRDLVIRHCLSLRKYGLMMVDNSLIQFNEKPLFSLK